MQNGTCKDAVNGTVTIRNTTKKVSLPTVISYKDKQFHISGTIPIKWAEYGVEDPSIFIASVDDTVFVSYDVIVGKQD
jgi:polyisoprenoid-binding protein YceI